MGAGAMLALARRGTVKDLFALFHSQIYVPKAHGSQLWKLAAEPLMTAARKAALGPRPVAGCGEPIEVYLLLVFELPRSRVRARSPLPRAWQTSARAGDFDNLAKPVCDAANGVLWPDDCQVARCAVEKIVGAQGERARVEMLARRLEGAPKTLFAAVRDGREWSPNVPDVAYQGEIAWREETEPEPAEASSGPPLRP
jgi:Holliday junction resolvase RusA-like endonuclease